MKTGRSLSVMLMTIALLSACFKRDETWNHRTASDEVLSEHVPGLWRSESLDTKVGKIVMYFEFTPTHEAKYIASIRAGTYVEKGTWKVQGGKLVIEMVAPPGETSEFAHAENWISSLSSAVLELKDKDDPAETPDRFDKVSAIKPEDDKPLISSTSKAPAEATLGTPTPAEAPPPAAVDPAIHMVLQTSSYIPKEELAVLHFSVPKTSNTKIAVNVEQQVPIDMVVLPWSTTENGYDHIMMAIGTHDAQELGKALGDTSFLGDPSKNPWTASRLFGYPLSKKGVYGQYESEWVSLSPGDYTIILDNEGNFTPTRGDAPVQIAVYTAE